MRAVKWAFPEYDYTWLIEEVQRNLPQELDFENEALNAQRCKLNFSSPRCPSMPMPCVATAGRSFSSLIANRLPRRSRRGVGPHLAIDIISQGEFCTPLLASLHALCPSLQPASLQHQGWRPRLIRHPHAGQFRPRIQRSCRLRILICNPAELHNYMLSDPSHSVCRVQVAIWAACACA